VDRLARRPAWLRSRESEGPAFAFGYLEGGAEDEVTMRRNRDAFRDIVFSPRVLASNMLNRSRVVQITSNGGG
jgi:isopentenyl diphosphate isomerase/L-lactate dehydrogenase-like FMN-dependent dehydrogenase